ncbi:L-allo-threonine aldolase [Nonomuraea coxensis DSM 45129]|uniref:L-allo-threonine aldolase n=1 Tax=Nonomuraea coxensis DSM 45129 TaxID=1122611 RepID=A0ABX8U1I6_9ACTN|nr:GntG family PLP-dependent aldolase [Nonomuraea coxensis]QYC41612.1 L-allo-threonine aldolase [Nonomuraea coxensis DSM 45129]
MTTLTGPPAPASAGERGTYVELRSDTFTLPTPAMLEAAASAPLGDDVYGEDPTVARLERLAAGLLGKDAACLMPSGTMANLAAVLAHCPRGGKAVVGRESDLYVYEAGGASVCGGVVYEPLPNQPDGTILLSDLEEALTVDRADPQFAVPALVALESPQNRCGGVPVGPAYLAEAAGLARRHGAALHLDGARLFNAATALGVTPAELAAPADTVQICLSKGLCAPIGSLLVGEAGAIGRARRIRKLLGGGMRQAGVIAACGILALTEMTGRLAEDHENAARLARGLSGLPGLELDPGPPATNMVFFRVRDPRHTTRSFIDAARERGVRMEELGHGRIRAVTHAGVTTTDIDHTVNVLRALLTPPVPTPGGGR